MNCTLLVLVARMGTPAAWRRQRAKLDDLAAADNGWLQGAELRDGADLMYALGAQQAPALNQIRSARTLTA